MSLLGMPKVIVTKVPRSAVNVAQANTIKSENSKKVMVPKISLPSDADLHMPGHINVLDLPFNKHKLYVRTAKNEEPKIAMAPLVHHKPRRQPPYGRKTTVFFSGNKPVLLMMEAQQPADKPKDPKKEHPPECVHKLIEKPKVEPPKPPRYVSKYRPQVLIESKANKEAWRLMGPPKDVSLDRSKQPSKPTPQSVRRSRTKSRPPVPPRTERPLMGLESNRDFVKENLLMTLPTAKKAPVFMDSKGRRQLLESSGLFPFFLNKKGYGKVPEYIESGRQKDEAKRAKDTKDKDKKKEESKDSESSRTLSDEERKDILVKLKNTWKSLDIEHKQLPFILDNPCRLDNKVRLEEELKELEDQITFFERPGPIVITEQQS